MNRAPQRESSGITGLPYTLADTLADQKDLPGLCHDRPLRTCEIYEPNAYYGLDQIVKLYAGLPSGYPLKAILPHGIDLSAAFVSEVEKKGLLPVLYYYPPHRRSVATRQMNKIALAGAFPFLYLLDLLKAQPQPERQGLLFFPAHSTHHYQTETDFARLADKLDRLEKQYQPISVCVYWQDILKGHHHVFQSKGLRVVSAGHMFDPLFLHRFYHLCRQHAYAASNEIGSHLFYSVMTGCAYFHMGSHPEKSDQRTDTATSDLALAAKTRAMLIRLFEPRNTTMSTTQLNLVRRYMGSANFKTPAGLRAELAFAERLDRFGVARHPWSRKAHFKLPNLFPRRLTRNLKRRLINRGQVLATRPRGVAGIQQWKQPAP